METTKIKWDISESSFEYNFEKQRLYIDCCYDGELSYTGYIDIAPKELLLAMGYDVNGKELKFSETDFNGAFFERDIYFDMNTFITELDKKELENFANKNQNKIIKSHLN